MSAYFVIHNRILNPEKMHEYRSKAFETMEPYNYEILMFDENSLVIEGSTNLPRTCVIKFDSRDDFMAWYNSPEYQKVLPLRLEATEGLSI